jgi:O-antigen/teichoic acid export membrane protein
MNEDKRTTRAKKNIFISFLLKGCSILVSLLLVPLTLDYLNSHEYGIWLTLSSILMWVNYFDIGLVNGLRNKLTEALALGNTELAKKYVSTTFVLITIIVAIIYLLYFIINFFIDWYGILNIRKDDIDNINNLVSIVFLFFCFSFILKTIGVIFISNQMPTINDLLLFFSQLLSLIIIYILTKISNGNLKAVAITYSCAPVIIYLAACPITFMKFVSLRPSFSYVDIKYAKDLIGLGLNFFIIQISSLIIFSSSNILIIRLLGAEYVTSYNIAHKYFSIIGMVFHIIISPFWSAITDAYIKNDCDWIKHIIHKIKIIYFILSGITIILIILSDIIYRLWIGTEVKISFSISVLSGLYIIILNWSNIFVCFINGTGKLKIELLNSISLSIAYIPLAIILGKNFGLNGIIGAMCIVCLQGGILFPIQYTKIINKTAKGIWNK